MHSIPAISVIICAYTDARWRQLLACVDAVRQQTLPAKEIIVIIDHNPALLNRARTKLQGIFTAPNRNARGLAGARNAGVQLATGDILAFIDEDATAARDWLARLAEQYTHANVIGVGGAIIPAFQIPPPQWLPAEFWWVVGCSYRGLPECAAPVRNLIGCNMSFRRIVFERAGGFENSLGRIGAAPMGCEETEFCIRAHQHLPHGFLVYDPHTRVYHHVPPQRTRVSYFLARCFAEGRSKARVAALVGADAALASERAFAMQTLRRAIAENLALGFTQHDAGALARAGAIVVGLGVTTVGYAVGTFTNYIDARLGIGHNLASS